MFKVPFSILPTKTLRRIAYILKGLGHKLEPLFPFLKLSLKQAETDITAREYISMSITATAIFFIFFSIFLTIFLKLMHTERYFIAIFITLIISFFILIQQLMYPRLIANKKVKDIDRNLLAALQDILIQLNSGIAIFDIFVNVSRSNYGKISIEFGKAVKQINSGTPQIEALEELALNNPSVYFRRAIWQLVNGMKAGSDLSTVMKDIIKSLSQEQLTQIQNYGSQLNPLAMFYMLIAVIIPALAITFITVISSFVAASPSMTKVIFGALYFFVVFFQIMFLGLIKSRRPNLLGNT